MRRRGSCLRFRILARMRLRIVVRRTVNRPSLFFPLICWKPRKSNVSGFPFPLRLRFSSANLPNSIRRVLSGCNSSPSLANRSRKFSRRVYIQKEDGRQRPLGVAAVEDKIVQQAVVTILNQIYEEAFLGFSYGFRPGRSQHDALDALSYALLKKKVNYILDADVRSFFDNLDKGWMIKFIEHRVADPRILRLIQKWLKAGVMEEGKWSEPKTGTPQGSVISPMLANVYLHYVFDLWVNVWRNKWAQ